jgi:hypothetical protein
MNRSKRGPGSSPGSTSTPPARSTFWLKESDGRLWHLYVVSDEITDENNDQAYGKVIRTD